MTAEGQPITYRRGLVQLSITAMPDSPQETNITVDGISLEYGERDFAVNLVDLLTLGLPEEGDQIDWVSAGKTYTHKAFQTGGTKCYDTLDNHNLRFAVHTKLISVK